MIRIPALIALIAASITASAGVAKPAPAPKWHRIFDGRSLRNWTPKIVGQAAGQDMRKTFVVRNGAVRVSYAGYDRFDNKFGHLFYDKPLKFFRLRLRYRFLEPGLVDTPAWARRNSGVMFLAQPVEQMGRDQDFPVSVEFQFLGRDGSGRRATGSVCTPGTNIEIEGKVAPDHCTTTPNGPTIPTGQWVNVELDVLPSGQIEHRINGKVVFRYANVTLDPADPIAKPAIDAAKALPLRAGYIALQSEGHPIEFADIAIQELK